MILERSRLSFPTAVELSTKTSKKKQKLPIVMPQEKNATLCFVGAALGESLSVFVAFWRCYRRITRQIAAEVGRMRPIGIAAPKRGGVGDGEGAETEKQKMRGSRETLPRRWTKSRGLGFAAR